MNNTRNTNFFFFFEKDIRLKHTQESGNLGLISHNSQQIQTILSIFESNVYLNFTSSQVKDLRAFFCDHLLSEESVD